MLSHIHNPGVRIVKDPRIVRNLSPLKDLQALFFLKKFFEEEKFDVVHTHSSKAGILGRIAAHMAGVPVVVHTIHGLAFGPYDSFLKNKIYIGAERFAAKYSDRIYAVAQAMIDQCLTEKIGTPDLFQVVYSGMELERFLNAQRESSLRKELSIPEQSPVVGAVARLFTRKGYEDFFPTAKKILKKIRMFIS